jgi:tetratricopeptide (TPR) repeat protein
MALSGKGRHEKAAEEFSKVIEMSQSPILYKDRGTAYRKLGEYELALKDFEKALELDKKFAPAYASLGLLYALTTDPSIHNPQLALSMAEKAVELTGGSSPDMLETLAEVQQALNRNEDAVRTLQKALAMDPANQEYRELLAKWRRTAVTREEEPRRTGTGPFTSLW